LSQLFKVDLCFLICFWSTSLVAGAHTVKCREVRCLRFEPRSLHKLCNVPTNWNLLMENRIIYLYYSFMFSKFLVFNVIQVSGNVVSENKLYKKVLNKVWLQFTSSSSPVKNDRNYLIRCAILNIDATIYMWVLNGYSHFFYNKNSPIATFATKSMLKITFFCWLHILCVVSINWAKLARTKYNMFRYTHKCHKKYT